jgi:16S rRNA (uracil1498-N3)-methyltransferase
MPAPRPFTAPRLYCEGALAPGATIELPERAARHVAALRLQVGDEITLFSGDGCESSGRITFVGKRGVTAAVLDRDEVSRESPLAITLVQGICAADRMDLVLQKATELGVTEIVPVVTSRTVVRLTAERRDRRHVHWRNVLIAACEQCGRNNVPQLAAPAALRDYFAIAPRTGTRIVLTPEGEGELRSLSLAVPVTVLIGPEGGLAPEERTLAATLGFTPTRFGPRILRTETAPLAVIAVLQALHGDC